MPKYDSAFSTKTSHGPTAATRSPAIAGPIAREALMATLFKATADCSSSGRTRSGTIDAHAGIIIAAPTPRAKMNPSNTQTVVRSSKVRMPSAPATISR